MKITLHKKPGDALAFEASNESNLQVDFGASTEVGGDGSGFRPMEMMLAATGACTSIDVCYILQKMHQKYESMQLELVANRRDQDPKTFEKIHIKFIFSGNNLDLEKLERAVKLSAEKYCSASIMLRDGGVAFSSQVEITSTP